MQEYEYVNRTYDNMHMDSTKAIQLTPRSYPRILKKFVNWCKEHKIDKELDIANKEMAHLEDNKKEFSKSRYMIEHGSVERVNKKIDTLQEKIDFLNEEKDLINNDKNVKTVSSKPLRLVPKMFNQIRDTFYYAVEMNNEVKSVETAKTEEVKPVEKEEVKEEKTVEREYEAPIVASEFTRDEEKSMLQLMEDKAREVEASNTNTKEVEEDNDRVRQLPSVTPAKLELSVSQTDTKTDTNSNDIDDKFIKDLEESLQKELGNSVQNTIPSTVTKLDSSTLIEDKKPVIPKIESHKEDVSELDSLEAMKANFLKIQAQKEEQIRKEAETLKIREEQAIKEAEAKRKREEATKLREKAMNECIEATRMAQEELTQSMEKEQQFKKEIELSRVKEQEEIAKANQELKASKEIEAMISALNGQNTNTDSPKTL